MQKITIHDVAREAGVSVSTVSRVINGNETVNDQLRGRVMHTVERLGYVPNASARSVRAGSSDLIGVVIPTARIAVFAEVLQGVMDTAMRHGFRVNVYSSDGEEERDLKCIDSVASSGAGGLIYCPIASISPGHLEKVRLRGIPVVVALRRSVAPGIPHVYMDDEMGAYRATRYLLQQGRRRIAFFAGFWTVPEEGVDGILNWLDSDLRGAYTTLDRMAGYRRALAEAGLELEKELIAITAFDYKSGYRVMKNFLSTLTDFDALVCGNDLVAAGAMEALKEQNISIPESVSVIGYDDSELARIAHPKLTSVRQCAYDIGCRAADTLLCAMRGEAVSDSCLPAELNIRASTAVKNPERNRL